MLTAAEIREKLAWVMAQNVTERERRIGNLTDKQAAPPSGDGIGPSDGSVPEIIAQSIRHQQESQPR